jgi:hypothetical protein
MSRVDSALQEGRCVLAVGSRALGNTEVLAELRRRSLPAVALGTEVAFAAGPLTADSLSPALKAAGGVIVLVEPEPGADGRGISSIEAAIKGAAHKPRIVVVAKAFNPFGLPAGLRVLKVDHEKSRAQDFLAQLPAMAVAAPAPAAAEAPAAAKAGDASRAPRPLFVGRTDETAALVDALRAEGAGPVVLVGPSGVGRRWLAEKSIAEAGLTRLPDFMLARDFGADAFLGRMALVGRSVGDDRLFAALSGKDRPAPLAVAALVVEVAQNPALAGKAMLVTGLESVLDARDGSFYKDGRLELAVAALLRAPLALRVVFTSTLAPAFYVEGEGRLTRVLPVAGLKGRELHELYANYAAPEFSRDRFGPISERTHGHPLTNRFFALTVREDGDVDNLLEQPRFLRGESVGDLAALERHLKNRVGKLDEATRKLLAAAALPRDPVSPEDLQALGINRQARIQLLSDGLLEQTPHDDGRRYHVHPLVAAHLDSREVEDFDRMEAWAAYLHERSRERKKAGDTLQSFALAQEGNRVLVSARRLRSRLRLPVPDNDGFVDAILRMTRRKTNPRPDIARQWLADALAADALNPDLHLLDAELKGIEKAPQEAIDAAWARAAAVGLTPEVYHQQASLWISRNQRPKAIAVLKDGVAAFPQDGRMHRRLAGLLVSVHRPGEAIEVLKLARDLEPLMPDTYAMLAELYAAGPADQAADAEANIAEALRLSPDSPQLQLRKAGVLRARALALADDAAADALIVEAEALVDGTLKVQKDSARALSLMATLLLDRRAEDDRASRIERAGWMLDNAAKKGDHAESQAQKARSLVYGGKAADALALIEKVIRREGGLAEAYLVKAEALYHLGDVFSAVEVLKLARERTPRGSALRAAVERTTERYTSLITSGGALELLKAAGSDVQSRSVLNGGDAVKPAGGGGKSPKAAGGATTVRREGRGRKGRGAAEAGAEAGADADAAVGQGPSEPGSDGAEADGATAEVPDAGDLEAADSPPGFDAPSDADPLDEA